MKKMRPGVKALIVHEGKILMVKERVHENNQLVEIVDFPGGGIEFGEGLHEALIREVKEEVSLDIIVGKVVGAWDFVVRGATESRSGSESEASGTHIVCIGYQCSVVGQPIIDVSKNPAQEDIYDTHWYTQSEILEDQDTILGNAGMIAAVENLKI